MEGGQSDQESQLETENYAMTLNVLKAHGETPHESGDTLPATLSVVSSPPILESIPPPQNTLIGLTPKQCPIKKEQVEEEPVKPYNKLLDYFGWCNPDKGSSIFHLNQSSIAWSMGACLVLGTFYFLRMRKIEMNNASRMG